MKKGIVLMAMAFIAMGCQKKRSTKCYLCKTTTTVEVSNGSGYAPVPQTTIDYSQECDMTADEIKVHEQQYHFSSASETRDMHCN